jgi:hypothetical protein
LNSPDGAETDGSPGWNVSWLRIPLMVCAGLMLLLAMWGGLSRLGMPLPAGFSGAGQHHGILMVGGFLGTLIGLERASALNKVWPWAVPLFAAAGGLLLLTPADPVYGGSLQVLAGLLMTLVFGYILSQQFSLHGTFLMLAAACWFGGSSLWTLGWPVYDLVYWWMGFLVLTITAERLELNRVGAVTTVRKYALAAGSMLFLLDLGMELILPGPGKIIVGLSLIGMGTWLLRFDLARANLRLEGGRRYGGICLFSSYLWLTLAGTLLALSPRAPPGAVYDSILHAVFLGFVFSMIFGHALVIFPSVVDLPVAYHPVLYVPLVLLHGSLILRLTGNALNDPSLRMHGAGLNVLSIVGFLMLLLLTGLTTQTSTAATGNKPVG